MGLSTLEVEHDAGVAEIRLDRAEHANAIDLQMSKELLEVALRCDEDPEVRAVLLLADGKMFCAGGDLRSFAHAEGELPLLLKQMTVYLHAAVGRLARMDAPVVAAVQGTAAGAGFSLMCAADLVVASEAARFTMAYTRAGLTPDGSSTHFLPRLIGRHRTLELILTNRTLDAAEALRWGLVNRVCAPEDVQTEARALAQSLAKGPTAAFGSAKRLVQSSFSETLESQMELESQAIADAARTADAREGIAAFLEKRKPSFEGR